MNLSSENKIPLQCFFVPFCRCYCLTKMNLIMKCHSSISHLFLSLARDLCPLCLCCHRKILLVAQVGAVQHRYLYVGSQYLQMGQLLLLHWEQVNFCLLIRAAMGTGSPVLTFTYVHCSHLSKCKPSLDLGNFHWLLLHVASGFDFMSSNLPCRAGLFYPFLFSKRVKLVTLDCTQQKAESQLCWFWRGK